MKFFIIDITTTELKSLLEVTSGFWHSVNNLSLDMNQDERICELGHVTYWSQKPEVSPDEGYVYVTNRVNKVLNYST